MMPLAFPGATQSSILWGVVGMAMLMGASVLVTLIMMIVGLSPVSALVAVIFALVPVLMLLIGLIMALGWFRWERMRCHSCRWLRR